MANFNPRFPAGGLPSNVRANLAQQRVPLEGQGVVSNNLPTNTENPPAAAPSGSPLRKGQLPLSELAQTRQNAALQERLALKQQFLAERGLISEEDPTSLREQLLAQRLQQTQQQKPKDPTQFLAASLIGSEVTAADEGTATIEGEAGKTYNLLSDQGVEMNVLYDTLLGDGVGPTQTAINIQASDGSVWSIVFKIEAGADGPTAQAFLTHGNDDPIPLQPNGLTFTLPDGGEVSMQSNDDGTPLLVVQTGEYAIQQQIGPGPSIALQIETGEQGAVQDGQAPDGFLGQTFVNDSANAQDLSTFETEDPNLVASSVASGSDDADVPVSGAAEVTYSVEDLKVLIDSVDFDGDGVASQEELAEVASLPLEQISAQAQFLLDHIDQIGQDGKISKTDIENAASAGDPTVLTASDLEATDASISDPAATTTSSPAASVSAVSTDDINSVFSLADTDGNGVDQAELQQLQGNISSLKDLFSSLGQGLDGLVDSLLGNISSTAQFMIDNFDAMSQADGDATTIAQTDVDVLKGNDGDDSNVSLDDLPSSNATRLADPSLTDLSGTPLEVLQAFLTADGQGDQDGTVSQAEVQQLLDQTNADIQEQLGQLGTTPEQELQIPPDLAAKQTTARLLQALLFRFDEISSSDGQSDTISLTDILAVLVPAASDVVTDPNTIATDETTV